MTEENPEPTGDADDPRVVVIGPDGMATSGPQRGPSEQDDGRVRTPSATSPTSWSSPPR